MRQPIAACLVTILLLTACGDTPRRPAIPLVTQPTIAANEVGSEPNPSLQPVTLPAGTRLRVVATTNMVADVVRQVGGEHIDFYAMLPPGVDPHGFNPTPQDMRAVADAHVIFSNGLGLEGFLEKLLVNAGGNAPLRSVNVGVMTLAFDANGAHATDPDTASELGQDPHTWFRVPNLEIWTRNVAQDLSALDPVNASAYRDAADSYIRKLVALQGEIQAAVAQIPGQRRKLVTDHEAFGYFAHEYGFQIVGTVVPSFSTIAQPAAQELSALQAQVRREGVPAMFVGTTVNPALAEQMARDLGIKLVTLYTGSFSGPDGPAADYIAFMRFDVQAIVEALR